MTRDISEVLIHDQHVAHAMLDVEPEHAVDGFDRNSRRLRRKRGCLAERALKTATARGEQHSDRQGPATRKAELVHQRRMLNPVDRLPQFLRNSRFAVADEHLVEVALHRRRQGAVVTRPKMFDASTTSVLGHLENDVGLLNAKRKTDSIPALP